MIGLGEGIAIAGLAIAFAPVAIAAIRARRREPEEPPALAPCLQHSGTVAMLENLKAGQARIDKNIEKIFAILDGQREVHR
jgi:hypothetical protein